MTRELVLVPDISIPRRAIAVLVNAGITRCIGFEEPLVADVLRSCRDPQILYSVVGAIPVDMVDDHFFGNVAIVVSPNQTMEIKSLATNAEADVAKRVRISGLFSFVAPLAAICSVN
jgi:hypothetical protein